MAGQALQALLKLGINVSQVVGFGSDGASVMAGQTQHIVMMTMMMIIPVLALICCKAVLA